MRVLCYNVMLECYVRVVFGRVMSQCVCVYNVMLSCYGVVLIYSVILECVFYMAML